MKESNCKKCGKEFTHPEYREASYCSRLCSAKSKVLVRVIIICKTCNIEFGVKPSLVRMTKYCSYTCFEQRKGKLKARTKIKIVTTFWDDTSLI